MPGVVVGKVNCGHCGEERDGFVKWMRRSDFGYHLGQYCHSCRTWIKWLPQTEENVRLSGGWPVFDGSHGEQFRVKFSGNSRHVLISALAIALRDGIESPEDLRRALVASGIQKQYGVEEPELSKAIVAALSSAYEARLKAEFSAKEA